MRAIVYRQTGAPSVLRLIERAVPEPEAGEVRIRIIVSGVNPTDWKSRRGSTAGESLGPNGVVPNQDGAGIVDAVGAGVRQFRVGDRVWTAIAAFDRPTGGTAQEYSVLPEDRVYPLPDAASFDLGASLGVPALTAHRALTVAEDGPSRLSPAALSGKIVLVAGGAGAVGHAAIQLARWAGATVITTISTAEKAALASAAGAHHVVNYRDSDPAFEILRLAPDGVDLIVEVAPDKNAELDARVIRNRGSIAVYATTGDPLVLDIRTLMTLNVRYQFQLLYTQGRDARDAAAEDITAAIIDGALPIGRDAGLPLHRYSLAQTAEAHAAVEGDIVGKVLIDVASRQ
ncbi:MAG: NADPH:quinone reductase [Actinomycetota bacterium]